MFFSSVSLLLFWLSITSARFRGGRDRDRAGLTTSAPILFQLGMQVLTVLYLLLCISLINRGLSQG